VNNLIDTWLEYRKEVFGEIKKESLSYLTEKLGKRAVDRNAIYLMRVGKRSATDAIQHAIDADFPDMLRWLLCKHNIPATPTQIKKLSADLKLPIKRTALSK